jgi:hypothetical protein
MIQRIQSVFLALASILILATPFADGIVAPDSWAWYTPVAVALVILAAAGAFGAIFLYRQRERQRTLVLVDQLLLSPLIALLFVGAYYAGVSDVTALLPLGLPLLAYILLYLARRSIARDIELVRSMDRLR